MKKTKKSSLRLKSSLKSRYMRAFNRRSLLENCNSYPEVCKKLQKQHP